ncbi:MAG: hypothetical protein ABW086_09335 [Sedimenticola sp.]
MNRKSLTLMALVLPSLVQGACIQDSVEIGDTGPDSQQVCDLLNAHFPRSDAVIINRDIHASDSVTVKVSLNDRIKLLNYTLSGATWSLMTIGIEETPYKKGRYLSVMR